MRFFVRLPVVSLALALAAHLTVSPRPVWCPSGAMKTLHPYRVPSAMFIDSPPARRHQRLIPVPPLNCIPVLV